MPYQTTYAGIKADLIIAVEDTSLDFLNHVDAIIALSERIVYQDLDLELFQGEVSAGNTTGGNPLVAIPSILAPKSVWITVGGQRILVKKRTYEYLLSYAPNSSTQVAPSDGNIYFAERDTTYWYLAPTPDGAYAITAYGLVLPAGLSDSNPTTWLSVNAGDLLFKTALIQSEKYLKSPDQVTVWKDDYADMLAKTQLQLRGQKRPDYELARQSSTASQPL